MRRAMVLQGLSADAGDEPRDPARAEILHRIAAKVADAVERSEAGTLTAAERALLVTQAAELTDRVARELERVGSRELRRAEEWGWTARALREVAEATRTAED
jgi:hypothetical protein